MEDERIFQKVVRRLKIVVDRPTPVWVKQIDKEESNHIIYYDEDKN